MHKKRHRSFVAVTAAALLVTGATACGSDDDEESTATEAPSATGGSDSTAAPATTAASAATSEPATTSSGTGAGGDVDAFCQAELEAEQAAQSEQGDPSVAFEALVAASPEEIKGAVEEVIANAESGPGDPAFDEPYGQVIAYMQDNCGFTELAVEGADYSFTGLPQEVAAGPAIVTFDNVGEELHEVAFARINDGVTETVEELLQLSEEEAFSKITPVGAGFAFPGASSFAVVDLSEPGTYVATCFIPEGLTPEVAEQLEAMETEGTTPAGSTPDSSMPEGSMGSMPEGSGPMAELGPPHAILGMVQEFTVT